MDTIVEETEEVGEEDKEETDDEEEEEDDENENEEEQDDLMQVKGEQPRQKDEEMDEEVFSEDSGHSSSPGTTAKAASHRAGLHDRGPVSAAQKRSRLRAASESSYSSWSTIEDSQD